MLTSPTIGSAQYFVYVHECLSVSGNTVVILLVRHALLGSPVEGYTVCVTTYFLNLSDTLCTLHRPKEYRIIFKSVGMYTVPTWYIYGRQVDFDLSGDD